MFTTYVVKGMASGSQTVHCTQELSLPLLDTVQYSHTGPEHPLPIR